jgi:hypothetical protein
VRTRSLGTIGLIVTLPIVATACTNSPNLVRDPSPSTAPPAPVSIVQEDVRVNVSSAVIQSAQASEPTSRRSSVRRCGGSLRSFPGWTRE